MFLKRGLLLITGALGLFAVYFFQDYLDVFSVLIYWEMPRKLDYTSDYQDFNKLSFIFNKASRYILNDLFAIFLIGGLFYERKYIRFSFYVMIFGLLTLLPLYIFLYFRQPEGFSSMLGHLHRIVMNPALMMLLIPAFYYQKNTERKRS